MSYLALARKWRPRSFDEIVGQQHVVRALQHALAQDSLHHALLFSGTRGVGKTTLARIIAKCLNAEEGVTATPDPDSDVSQAIEQGRFVDLIEVDAASRTGVDDTREMLENVQYAPTAGRYKVYLIDEVHMFSKHSFNALLKTLEEPPPHVQFLLATTDPQKLPVTILSRCLQFNLKCLPVAQIQGQLNRILEAEGVSFEADCTALVARAADGSMRDALSLLDQAIAFGGQSLKTTEIREMLGTIDRDDVHALLRAVATGSVQQMIDELNRLEELAPDHDALLESVAGTIQRMAVLQMLPESATDEDQQTLTLSASFTAEDLQLYYQIALGGRRDLVWAPDPRSGVEMTLLRMIAFRPDEGGAIPVSPAPAAAKASAPPAPRQEAPSPEPQAHTTPPLAQAEAPPGSTDDWDKLRQHLDLSGIAAEVARQCVLVNKTDLLLELRLPTAQKMMLTDSCKDTIETAVKQLAGEQLNLKITIADGEGESPAMREARLESERQAQAEQTIHEDPVVQSLQEQFGATIQPGSIKPLDTTQH